MTPDHRTVGLPIGTRLLRIERVDDGWRLWLGTRDFVLGNYLHLNNNGEVWNITARSDEGDQSFKVRPSDRDIRGISCK